MTAWRRYSYEWPGTWHHGHYSQMRAKLKQISESFWYYQDAVLMGEPFGRLAIVFTAAGNDQWTTIYRARFLAEIVFAEAGIKRIPKATWEKLEPHTHRGRHRVPVPASGSPA